MKMNLKLSGLAALSLACLGLSSCSDNSYSIWGTDVDPVIANYGWVPPSSLSGATIVINDSFFVNAGDIVLRMRTWNSGTVQSRYRTNYVNYYVANNQAYLAFSYTVPGTNGKTYAVAARKDSNIPAVSDAAIPAPIVITNVNGKVCTGYIRGVIFTDQQQYALTPLDLPITITLR